MKMFKKVWFWIVVALLLVIGAVFVYLTQTGQAEEYITETVERGTLIQTVDTNGSLESASEVDLNFEMGGAVSGVLVKVGDTVAADQLLATLDATELAADVENARQALSTAQGNLNQRYAGSTGEEIRVADAGVKVAEAGVAGAKTALQNAQDALGKTADVYAASVDSAEVSLTTAEATYYDTVTQNNQTMTELWQDYVNVLKSAVIEVRSALTDADSVLGIDNSLANNDFEDVLGNVDATSLSQAQTTYIYATSERDYAEEAVTALTTGAGTSEIESAAEKVEIALAETEETLLYTRRVLDGTTVDTATFSFSDLSAMKASIDAARNAVQTQQTLLLAQQQAISSATISTSASATSTGNAVASAKAALTSAKAAEANAIYNAEAATRSSESNLAAAEADLLRAQASLAQVSAAPRGVDVASLQAEVRRSEAALAAAEARYKKSEIRTPIAGTVTTVSVDVGEQVSAGMGGEPVMVVQTTEERFKVTAYVDEVDIAKVSPSDPVEITFDAFGDEVFFTGAIDQIDPAKKEIEGVVYYQITVYLDDYDHALYALKPGLSADLTITTESISDALIVSQRSVLQRNDQTQYIRVIRGAGYREQDVETGVRGDSGRVQITDGLNEGEEIVVTIRQTD